MALAKLQRAPNVPSVSDAILQLRGLSKTYPARNGKPGLKALDNVDLDIRKGEIFALLGPNGAGKTTLIGSVCGLVRPTGGEMHAFGIDLRRHWRAARSRIGLVPQELASDMFDKVSRSVAFSRGLFGLPPSPDRIEEVLRSLSLWDKRDDQIRALSGGMKRRVLIAKALAHDPELLFLDEPTAGVDVELRRDMWRLIGALRDRGTTVILTTHYIEEAQEMADRVGVIDKGQILLVEEKDTLMTRMGRTEAVFSLGAPLEGLPSSLAAFSLNLGEGGTSIVYRGGDGTGKGKREVADLTRALVAAGVEFTGIDIHESSLEDIFVDLVEKKS